MLYREVPKTGWKVSVIGFGAWGIGGQWGPVERDQAERTLRSAYEAGMNFFDTADAYGDPPGMSEQIMGRTLGDIRDRIYIASKVGNWARRLDHPLPYTSPLHVHLCCDASLHRLRSDYIDLYQCHIGNLQEPDVFLEAFEQLVQAGKIRAYGISTDSVEVAERFNRAGGCAMVQLNYSMLNRSAEERLLPWCQENRVATIIRGPLAQGVAAGKFDENTVFTDSVREKWNADPGRQQFLRQVRLVEKLRFLAAPGRSMAQAALQFVIAHPGVTTAIPGAKDVAQAQANAAAGAEPLDAQTLRRVQEATAK